MSDQGLQFAIHHINFHSSCTSMAPISCPSLPEELLELILQRVTDIVDLYQCSNVCHSWQSIARKQSALLPPQLLVLRNPNNVIDKIGGRKWANAPFKKTIQHFVPFSKLIREMPIFWNSIFSKSSYKKKEKYIHIYIYIYIMELYSDVF